MRLIDADRLYEGLANNLMWIMGNGENIDSYVSIGETIRNVFNEQPTAYDVDKVVSELEEIKEKCLENGDIVGHSDFKKAIEIVKAGGASDNH